MRKTLLIACSLVALAVAGPAAAHGTAAGQTTVLVGEQDRPPAGVPKSATLNLFFPSKVVVRAGSKVTFTSRGFHTVSFVKGKTPPIFMPDPSGAAYEGIVDAAGEEFAFNSLTALIFNVAAFAPSGGKTIDGRATASTGVLAPGPNGKPVSATYLFPKPGTYKLVCLIHPGMSTLVVVKPKAASVPGTDEVAAVAKRQVDTAWGKALAASKTKAPKNTVYAGIGAQATLLAFLPEKLTVKAGTTVRFVAGTTSEPHNIALGPQKWLDAFQKKNDLFPQGPKGKNQASPFFAYGSDPGQKLVYDGTNHGNGVLVTPLTSKAGPLPRAASVTFAKAGTYKYFCLLHGPDMAGTIVVTK